MDSADVVETIPLQTDAQGVMRVAGTRISLDAIVQEFEQGLTAEEIAHQFDVLDLADVYAVITYYLRHQNEVKQYLQKQDELAAAIRGKIEHQFPVSGLRERLLSKRLHGA